MGTGQTGHFTLWKSLCATYKDKRTKLAYLLDEKGTTMIRMYKGTSVVLFVCVSDTHTMVPCMQEVKEFFCTVFFSVGSGADAGFTGLQMLPGVHTVFSLLTLDSYRF